MRCFSSSLFIFSCFTLLTFSFTTTTRKKTSLSSSSLNIPSSFVTTAYSSHSSSSSNKHFIFEEKRNYYQKRRNKSVAFGITTTTTTSKVLPLTISFSSSSSSEDCTVTMETTTETKETTETETETILPNWRIHHKEANNNNNSTTNKKKSPLSPAAPWSSTQYTSSLALYNAFSSCTDSYLSPLVQDALHTLQNAYRLYGPLNVVGSYNGGKDAVVILHLMRAAHAKYCSDRLEECSKNNNDDGHDEKNDLKMKMMIPRPRVIYFDHADEFPQVTSLLKDTVSKFDLDMLAFEQGIKFGEGLTQLVHHNYPDSDSDSSSEIAPYPMAFVLGTRTTDPNAGSQGKFAPSSHYMPPFMRINPILDWEYGHVWHFLRLFQLPYCTLYDEGYTSLGTVKDTVPCPALAKVGRKEYHDGGDDDEEQQQQQKKEYFPAYMLRDWDLERAGRIVLPKKKVKDQNNESNDASVGKNAAAAATTTGGTATPPDVTISQSSSVVSLPEQEKITKTTNSNDNNIINNDDNASVSSNLTSTHQKTVGLLIIGDEILKGLVSDTNTRAAATALREQNVPLSRVVVVSDDQDDIVEEIQRMTREVDVIVTSGGVGPTHDDVTIKSVGAALGRAMVFHEEMGKLLREKMDGSNNDNNEGGVGNDGRKEAKQEEETLTEAQIKMATLPASSKLRYFSNNDDDDEWPILQCHNIFVLPGVPQFFRSKIKSLSKYLSSDVIEKSEVFKVVLSADESSIVGVLNKVVTKHPYVCVGSYPFVDHPQCKTVVTLEGRMFDYVGGGDDDDHHDEVTKTNNNNNNNSNNSSSCNANMGNSGRFAQRALLRSVVSTGKNGELSSSLSSAVVFSKEEMDKHVRLALADLVNGMPEGSVLRVDNNDDLTF